MELKRKMKFRIDSTSNIGIIKLLTKGLKALDESSSVVRSDSNGYQIGHAQDFYNPVKGIQK
jgi:hypothetical protein